MTLRRRGYLTEKHHPGTRIPFRVDMSRWEPDKDKKGQPIKPGDYVSNPMYPRGTVRGTLKISKKKWSVLRDGTEVASLVLVTDDGTEYGVTSKVMKVKKGKR